MTFLAPAFLIGLTALAIPVLIHLIQRERKRIVEFPSLMFLRRIPYQSVRRRTIRHWFLLLLRAAAVLLIVAAFARPFFRQGALGLGASVGAREIVVLLDQSASMGYGNQWSQARAAAREVIDSLGRDDRATLVLFSRNAEENIRATSDRARLRAAVEAAKVGSGATRYGPALKLAQSILDQSSLQRREAVLISDFQQTGWTGSEEVRFPEGTTLTPVSVASEAPSNISVSSVAFARTTFAGQERVTLTAGVVNRSATAANLTTTLEIDGRVTESKQVSLGAQASTSVSFAPFTLAEANVRGTVKAGTDALPQDNMFHVVLTPGRPLSVLIIDQQDASGDRSDPSLYLSKALAIGNTPAFQTDAITAGRAAPGEFREARGRHPQRHALSTGGVRAAPSDGSSSKGAACSSCSAHTARGRRATRRSSRERSARRWTA